MQDKQSRCSDIVEGLESEPQCFAQEEKDYIDPHTASTLDTQPAPLEKVISHISTHDAEVAVDVQERDEHYEQGDEIYSRFSPKRKIVIVVILSLCSFLSPISSTSILAASPEVVATYHTTGPIFDVSNALYIVFMGISPLFWGPIGQTYGRKWTLCWSALLFTAFSAATAVAPNLASYFVFRMLTALNGTSFFVTGGAVIGDIYRAVDRGTAYGWFLSGTLIGPALGPFIGGIIVTYVSWRDIFWLQTALSGFVTVAAILFLPETSHYRRSTELAGLPRLQKAKKLWKWINPVRIIILFRYPNLLVAGLSTGALVWNMYSLLTPIRYVLNPRFGLTSPLQSGLFYIAPGCGYLFGTFLGGRWADRVVKRWIQRRDGERIPEDRLHSCLTAMGIVIPACMLVYGWSIDQKAGGVAVPVIAMFVQGAAQTFCFASINTYCIDVMQKRSSEVVAGNYAMRYMFAAAGSAACLPVIEKIGVGWFSTISAAFLLLAAFGTWAVTLWGRKWRESVDRRSSEKTEDQ